MITGKWSRGIVSSLVILCLTTAGSGCFGPFNLTRNVYNWNSGIKGSGEVNEKWMKEIVFFGMIVIPVYMFSALLDAFIFNAIQFWSGSNPVKVTHGQEGQIQDMQIGETTITWSWSTELHSAKVSYRRQGQLLKAVTIAAEEAGYRLVDETAAMSYLITVDGHGGMTIIDQDCLVIKQLSIQHLGMPALAHS